VTAQIHRIENRLSADIRELLQFYAEAGVDEAIEESPVDRFAEFAAQRAANSRTSAPASA